MSKRCAIRTPEHDEERKYTMEEMQVFRNEQFGEVRTIEENGKPLFCGSDVARALGYTNSRKALIDHCKGVTKRDTLTSGGIQSLSYIPESDVYRLIIHSKLPTAEKFEHWVFDEVLPTIRKHGAYITPNVVDQMIASPEFGIQLLTALKEERKKTAALQYENEQMLPKADYYDSFIHADASLSNFRDTAKQIGLPERAFINLLLDSEFIYRTTGRTREFRPNANKNAGYFVLKDFQASTGHVGKRTMITPQGKAHFSKIYRNIIEDFRINGKAIFKGGKNQ